jgi:micrococcal nuclease
MVTRALIFVVAAAIGIVLLLVIAPLLLIAALLMLLLAWKWPTTVGRVSGSPRLRPIPQAVRSTPMRFAASLVAVTFLLTATSFAAFGRQGRESDTVPEQAAAEVAAEPTASPTQEPKSTPTPRPSRTPRPTAAPTPTAEPTPTLEPTPVFGEEPTGPTQLGTVVGVADGDTIKVDVDGIVYDVRYIGVSTPEIHGAVEWLGQEANTANANLVAGKRVLLEKDVSETDQYGRLLRHVWVENGSGWLLVNLELVRLGFATVTTFPPDVKYIDELYVPAQAGAQTAVLGLWAPAPTPAPTPLPVAAPAAPLPLVPAPTCHASYIGACLAPGIGDYDCAGGSGNGPNYIAGPIQVVGQDEFDLDSDANGYGCEG